MNTKNQFTTDSFMSQPQQDKSLMYRISFALIVLMLSAVLVIAGYVVPDESGIGSHRQLSMSACGFYERTGYPCPTCGMTTAFAHVVRGQLLKAFWVQPAGTLAALACIAGVFGAGYLTITGKRLDRYLLEINWMMVIVVMVGIVLAAWGWLCVLTYFHLR